jgi:hypothetical protein
VKCGKFGKTALDIAYGGTSRHIRGPSITIASGRVDLKWKIVIKIFNLARGRTESRYPFFLIARR